MQNSLQYLLPAFTLLLFVVNVFYKGNTVQSCLLFILSLLPLMDLKITTEAYGGFKTFDLICFYCFVFLFKEFITINLNSRNNIYLWMFVALAIITLLGGLASEFPQRTYLNLLKLFPIFIFGRFLMTESIKDPSFFPKVIKALKISYITALVFLGIQWMVGLGFTFYPTLNPNTVDPIFHMVRYPGIFYDSQAHGQYLAMGSFLFLYTEKDASRRTYILNYLVFALGIIAINLAGSRAAFGGFLIGGFVVFLMTAGRYRVIGCVVLALAYIGFKSVTVHSSVLDRTENLSEDFIIRQNIWKEAYDIAKQHPSLGIGTGNYQNYVIRHAQDQYLEMEDGQLTYFDQPENGYLKILVELGFIGFAVFALYIIIPLIKGFIDVVKDNSDKRIAFLMGSLLSWVVAFNTVYTIYDYRLLVMVACMCVLIITYPDFEFYVYSLAEEQQHEQAA